LFSGEGSIKFGVPGKAFYSTDLTAQQAARAREICRKAGVTNSTFLDSCMIDVTVLKDETAAKIFGRLPAPHVAMKAGAPLKDFSCDCDHEGKRGRDHDHDKNHDRDHDHDKDRD
jgi:ABC-type Zn2+ transport system substrate-binding protein/surface adhesin